MADAGSDTGDLLLLLLSAWNEADGTARDTILNGALGASFIYEDPHAPEPFAGQSGMAEYLDVFRRNLPDAVLVPSGAPEVTHATAMVGARIDRAGVPFARLVFVGTAQDGALTRVTGFVETQ